MQVKASYQRTPYTRTNPAQSPSVPGTYHTPTHPPLPKAGKKDQAPMNAHDSVAAVPLAIQYYSSSAVAFRSFGVSIGLAGPDGFGRTATIRSSSSTSSLKPTRSATLRSRTRRADHLLQPPRNVVLRAEPLLAFLQTRKVARRHHTPPRPRRSRNGEWPPDLLLHTRFPVP